MAVLLALFPAATFVWSAVVLQVATDAVNRIYANNMEPALVLGRIDATLKNIRGHISAGYSHNPVVPASRLHSHSITLHTNYIRSAIEEIQVMWSQYETMQHSSVESKLVSEVGKCLSEYTNVTLVNAVNALDSADYDEAVKAVTSTFSSYVF